MITVTLKRIPVAVHHRSTEHQQELQREFQLILLGAESSDADVPQRLFDLIESLNVRYQAMTTEQSNALDEAVARGDAVIDELRYTVPADVADACISLNRMLDECDEYCRRGEILLTLATPAEAVAYRRWYLGEFVAQAKGAPPLAWDEADMDALISASALRGE